MKKWLLVKQARAAMEMTQSELGELMNVDLQEVSKWERNIVTIQDSRIHQLRDYYLLHTGDDLLFKDTIKEIMSKEYRAKHKRVRR